MPFKFFSFLLLPLFLCLWRTNSQDVSDDIIINRLSNDPVEGQGNQCSSLAGGTVFYIRGSGFSQMLSNNMVFLGSFQANVIGL